jgi:4-hydroxy-tetrahydrodipicolinate reductase
MTRMIISGACGRMGRMIAREAADTGIQMVAGIDAQGCSDAGFPVFEDFGACDVPADVLIDFSSPRALSPLLAYAQAHKLNCVLGTTGYTADDMKQIDDAAGQIAIFQSSNMSVAVYVLKILAAQAKAMLPGFDIEIIEKHHNKKADAPSGTALMLYEALKDEDSLPIFGREGHQTLRKPQEVGLHAVRGGTLAGEHEVGYYGNNECLLLTHSAQSRQIFALGALQAARFIVKQPAGRYGMAQMLGQSGRV